MNERPLAVLRRELAKNPKWAEHSTQAQLAALLGRSTGLIKNTENGTWAMTGSLARRVSDRLGVAQEWLMAPGPAQLPIPAEGGGTWSVDMIPPRLQAALQENVKTISNFMAETPDGPTLLAEMLTKQVRDRVVAELRSGKPEAFLIRLRQLLEETLD